MGIPVVCVELPGSGKIDELCLCGTFKQGKTIVTDSDAIDERYEFSLALIREAGDLANRYFSNRQALTIQSKRLQDMASEADLQTELLIKQRLAASFPQDAFLGEETGITAFEPNQGIWVVDPIDGTQPFISGMTSWCVSIAFVKDGVLKFGMVYAPARNELFAGGENRAATLNDKAVERHPARSVREGIVGVGYSPRVTPDEFLPMFERLLKAGGMFSREGSGALTLCYVASGRLIGYIEPHINSWDCLGAIAIIRAAGLKTNDFLANDGLRRGNPVIAGNEDIFAELAKISMGYNR
ncbi:inositol monophosphatase family protein (plasmid) [Ochrobactrum quorumnocens]|uniref:Inositol monophosphatase family protein n=1 Tax=Ochrobactrum quorumnocens TaxID=271865 RepID=A0A248ULI9_9HYPH|nr:inositol monophosphatase [[Ochrobactrum] quorumnocens]ASV87733.1 inositol monophosphatase family protein [[Ochrobactrum] quorumnocens]